MEHKNDYLDELVKDAQELNMGYDKQTRNEYVQACHERMSEYTEEERKKLNENLNKYLGITQEANDPQQRDVT